MTQRAQIHRFRDTVAIYLGDGSTVYLEPLQAVKIANKMKACAKDIKSNGFASSEFKTFEMGE